MAFPNQALNAMGYLYKQVLEIDLGRFEAVGARRPKRLPVALAGVMGGEDSFVGAGRRTCVSVRVSSTPALCPW